MTQRYEIGIGSLVMERGVQKGPVGEVLCFVDDSRSHVRVLWSDSREGPFPVDSLVIVHRTEGEGR